MRLILGIIIGMLAGPAFAGDPIWVPYSLGITTGDTVIFDTVDMAKTPQEIFRMSPGACLRGPLAFFRQNGEVIFRLEKDIEYPIGCGDKK